MDRTSQKENEEQTLKNILTCFAENTTAHGYAHIVNSSHKYLKVFWIVALISCHVYVIRNINILVRQYLEKSVTTSVQFANEFAPPFPVIVICNENRFRKEKINEIFQEIRRRSKDEYGSITNISTFDFLSLQESLKEKVYEYGTIFDEFIQSCSLYSRLDCKLKDYWEKTWDFQYGVCFVFNNDYYNNGSKKELSRVYNTGPYESLHLVINITQSQYYEVLTQRAGIQLYIGDQGSFYHLHHRSYSLSPGFSYEFQLRKLKIFRVDPFDNGTCVKHKPFEFYGLKQKIVMKYDADMCGFICLSELLIIDCNCTMPQMPKINNHTKLCGKKEEECRRKLVSRFFHGKTKCQENCRPSCDETVFKTTITSMQFPNLATIKKNNMSINDARENLIEVIFFFKTVSVKYWKERVRYGFENLLGDIGGQLGLMAGISILTIFELFYLLQVILKYLLQKVCKKVN